MSNKFRNIGEKAAKQMLSLIKNNENKIAKVESKTNEAQQTADNAQNAVDKIDTQTTTDTTLRNSKAGGIRVISIDGNSEQKTYSGKNLAKLNNEGVDWIYTERGIKNLAKNAELTRAYLKAGKTYTLSMMMFSRPTTDTTLVGYIDGVATSNDNGSWGALQNRALNTLYTLKYKPTVDCLLNFILFGNANSETFEFTFQIEEGSEATSFEKYVGGTASPNPDYPQEIKSFGDCVEMQYGAYNTENNGAYLAVNEWSSSKHPIPCKEGDVIEITTEKDNTERQIVFYNENGYLSHNFYKSAVTTPSGATKFHINVKRPIESIGKIALTVNGKYIIPIKTRGKNLLDCSGLVATTTNGVTFTPVYNDNGELEYINANGTATADTYYRVSNTSLNVGKYIASGSISGGSTTYRLVFYGMPSSFLQFNNGIEFELTTPISDKAVDISISKGVTVNNVKFYPMIREASIEDDTYTPYQEHTEYIYLDEPPRKVGDVADRIVEKDGLFGVERELSLNTFDGSPDEEWRASNETTEYIEFLYFDSLLLSDNILCDRFVEISWNDRNNVAGIVKGLDNGLRVSLPKTIYPNITDVSLFNEFLSKYPIAVIYKKNTPTFEPFDEESQKALRRLLTYDDVTYIDFDSAIQPSKIEVEYGTSKVGAYALKSLNNDEIEAITREEENKALETQINALQSAFNNMVNGNEVTY